MKKEFKVLYLTANYLDKQTAICPFRRKLMESIAKRCTSIMYMQVTDFYLELQDQFRSKKDEKFYYNAIRNYKPDLVISLNSCGITDKLLEQLQGVPIHVWFIDTPWRIPSHMVKPLREYQQAKLFAASDHACNWLKKNFTKNASDSTLYFAAERSGIDTIKPLRERTYDVVFVGTCWSNVQFSNNLLAHKPNDTQLKAALALLKEHYEDYDWELPDKFRRIFPNTKLRDDQIFASYDDECSNHIRVSTLNEIALTGARCCIAGNSEWVRRLGLTWSGLNDAFTTETVTDTNRLQELYADAKIAINICHHQSKLGALPIRCFDILESGALLLTNTPVDAGSGLRDQEHFWRYETAEDAAKLTTEMLEKIRTGAIEYNHARELLDEQHRYSHRAASLCPHEKCSNEPLSVVLASKHNVDFTVPNQLRTVHRQCIRPRGVLKRLRNTVTKK